MDLRSKAVGMNAKAITNAVHSMLVLISSARILVLNVESMLNAKSFKIIRLFANVQGVTLAIHSRPVSPNVRNTVIAHLVNRLVSIIHAKIHAKVFVELALNVN